jgi:hypothetical protein
VSLAIETQPPPLQAFEDLVAQRADRQIVVAW